MQYFIEFSFIFIRDVCLLNLRNIINSTNEILSGGELFFISILFVSR